MLYVLSLVYRPQESMHFLFHEPAKSKALRKSSVIPVMLDLGQNLYLLFFSPPFFPITQGSMYSECPFTLNSCTMTANKNIYTATKHTVLASDLGRRYGSETILWLAPKLSYVALDLQKLFTITIQEIWIWLPFLDSWLLSKEMLMQKHRMSLRKNSPHSKRNPSERLIKNDVNLLKKKKKRKL